MADRLNDVNTEKLLEVDGHVRENPALARVVFAATSSWQRGTKTEVTVSEVRAGGQPVVPPTRRLTVTVDEPDILGGIDSAPSPVETVLAALAGCVTAGIATNAQLFGVPLDRIDIALEADVDVRGVLGHDRSVRNGVTDIRYTVTIQSPAPEEQVRRVKETIDRKSPIRDTLANPVRITSTLVHQPR
jgi:uncharacterized OsmC-like protein